MKKKKRCRCVRLPIKTPVNDASNCSRRALCAAVAGACLKIMDKQKLIAALQASDSTTVDIMLDGEIIQIDDVISDRDGVHVVASISFEQAR